MINKGSSGKRLAVSGWSGQMSGGAARGMGTKMGCGERDLNPQETASEAGAYAVPPPPLKRKEEVRLPSSSLAFARIMPGC